MNMPEGLELNWKHNNLYMGDRDTGFWVEETNPNKSPFASTVYGWQGHTRGICVKSAFLYNNTDIEQVKSSAEKAFYTLVWEPGVLVGKLMGIQAKKILGME